MSGTPAPAAAVKAASTTTTTTTAATAAASGSASKPSAASRAVPITPGRSQGSAAASASPAASTRSPGGTRVIPAQLNLTGNPDVEGVRHEAIKSSLHTPHHMAGGADGGRDSNRTRGGTLCETPHEIRERAAGFAGAQ